MNSDGKVLLMILDGWGHGPIPERSAIVQGKTPFMDGLYEKYASAELVTHGVAVGLPEGQMGNSEVGHLNIGAGRVVYQELMRINRAIEDGALKANSVLTQAFHQAKERGSKLHFIGLVSDGGVHSHLEHVKALCTYADDFGLKGVFVHAFTDGRDCDPKSGIGFLTDLSEHIENISAEIATVSGRYYAMDRDKRWERIKLAYDALTGGKGEQTDDFVRSMENSYDNGVTDEFLKPIIVCSEGEPKALIEENDIVVCFNFRTDRCRQITQVLTQQDMPEFEMWTRELEYFTMTRYDNSFLGVNVIFEKEDLKNTIGEVVAKAGKTQLRIAETEKYPHVTFFFSGGREIPFEGEERIMIPSPKVATYDLQPEMSAPDVTEAVLEFLEEKEPDFICLNYANPDMVGHTGVFEAAVKAVETVDSCAERVVGQAMKQGYSVIVIADHGNCDYMKNDDGSPHTAHTLNPVPVFILNQSGNIVPKNGKLGDIAPTILTLMGLEIPTEMTGDLLL